MYCVMNSINVLYLIMLQVAIYMYHITYCNVYHIKMIGRSKKHTH